MWALKIDMIGAEPERVLAEIQTVLGYEPEQASRVCRVNDTLTSRPVAVSGWSVARTPARSRPRLASRDAAAWFRTHTIGGPAGSHERRVMIRLCRAAT